MELEGERRRRPLEQQQSTNSTKRQRTSSVAAEEEIGLTCEPNDIPVDIPLVNVKTEVAESDDEGDHVINFLPENLNVKQELSYTECYSDHTYAMPLATLLQAKLEETNAYKAILSENRDLKVALEKGKATIHTLKDTIKQKDLIIEKLMEERKSLNVKVANPTIIDTATVKPALKFAGPATLRSSDKMSTVSRKKPKLSSSSVVDNRAVALFHEVLPIFWEKFARYQENNLGYLDKTYLGLRLVCKTWMEALDKEDYGPATKLRRFRRINFTEMDISDLRKESIRMRIHYANITKRYLFHGSEMVVKDDSFRDGQNMSLEVQESARKVITAFLTTIGNKIQKFTFQTLGKQTSSFLNNEIWYNTFCNWITLMPQLQELTFQWLGDGDSNAPLMNLDLRTGPQLDTLNILNIRGVLCPPAVKSSLLLGNKHIQSLHFEGGINMSSIGPIYLPNLKFLSVTCSTVDYQLVFFENLEAQSLESLKIDIDIQAAFSIEQLSEFHVWFRKLVNELSKFRKTLRHLHLPLPYVPNEIQLLIAFKLENLETLVLESGSYWIESRLLKFVSKMKTLRQLTILDYNTRSYERFLATASRRINFYKFFDNRLVKKLWSEQKLLQKVEIQPRLRYQKLVFIRPVP